MGGAGLEPAAPSLSIWGSRSRPFAQVRSNSTRDPAGVRFDHLPTEDEVAQVSELAAVPEPRRQLPIRVRVRRASVIARVRVPAARRPDPDLDAVVDDWGSGGVPHREQNLAELNTLLLGQGCEEGVFGLAESFVGGCESALSG